MKKKSTPASSRKQMYLHTGPGGTPPRISRSDPGTFKVTDAYRASLPDMMEVEEPGPGAPVAIQQVGVSNFKLPLQFRTAKGRKLSLEASVTGTVSLDANLRGINMSRIVRSFYDHRHETFTPEVLGTILKTYRKVVGTLSARLRVAFSYPIVQRSLRSNLAGFQYYHVAYEASVDHTGAPRTRIEFDFVYSSACPCSAELAEHARDQRNIYAIAHNQRSKARVTIELKPGAVIAIEELQQHCLRALRTETQVMVKREDEQAFAELNGAYIKFVEDAARLLYLELNGDKRIRDFQVVCAHFESLHSHDAVSVICKGVPDGFSSSVMDFRSLAW